MNDKIRALIQKHCELPVDALTLSDQQDLYAAGLTSLASVRLMLALEENFNIEFPDNLLNRKTFSSIKHISDAITELQLGVHAA
jgi:acyl carrier protein